MLSPFVSQRLTMLSSKEHYTHIEAVSRFIEDGQVTHDRQDLRACRGTEAMRHLEAGKARGKISITT
jgi:hypothetical protein